LLFHYSDVDRNWLFKEAKQKDLQNRLGFVVSLVRDVAQVKKDSARAEQMNEWETLLEPSRLAREDTLCHESMTESEKEWLRSHRPVEAAQWNLLTDLRAEHLASF